MKTMCNEKKMKMNQVALTFVRGHDIGRPVDVCITRNLDDPEYHVTIHKFERYWNDEDEELVTSQHTPIFIRKQQALETFLRHNLSDCAMDIYYKTGNITTDQVALPRDIKQITTLFGTRITTICPDLCAVQLMDDDEDDDDDEKSPYEAFDNLPPKKQRALIAKAIQHNKKRMNTVMDLVMNMVATA